jgi:alkanesulfonate monooxygenase SsuD/methylene tetrahydromethanopterin reductase-like flavin-dependent oxidoreductase (luciferase family)
MRYTEALAQVRLVESLGFDAVFLGHHYGYDSYWPAPQVALAGFAAATEQLRIGTAILVLPLLSPLQVAADFVMLDQVSNGRVVLGVAIGWTPAEFAAFDVPMKERLPRLRESLELIKAVWTQDAASYSGDFFQVHDLARTPTPIQSPHPPIWVGGGGVGSQRIAAALGDAWLPPTVMSIGDMAGHFATIDELRVAAGKGAWASRPILRDMVLSATPAQAREDAERHLAAVFRPHLDRNSPQLSGLGDDLAAWAHGRFIIGDPDECILELKRYAAIGVTDVVLKPSARLDPARWADQLTLFAREVMPAF